MKQIMIDSSTMSKLISILKKVRRFLQYEMEEKKMIDVHTVNKKKQRKYIDSYNRKEKKINVHTINQKKAKKVHKFFAIRKKKKLLICTL